MNLTRRFRYASRDARVHAGEEALLQLSNEAVALGASRAFVVCPRSVGEKSSLLPRIESILGDRYAGAFAGAQQESPRVAC